MLDAIAALPVAVVVMPAIPVMTADVAEAIMSCPEWSIIGVDDRRLSERVMGEGKGAVVGKESR